MTPRAIFTLLCGIGLLAFLIAGYLILTGPSRRAASQARDDATMAQTRTTSAVEAINEIGELNGRAGVTETQVQEAQDAIRQAPPAARDGVARYQLCRLQHRPDCDRLLGTGSANPDPANAPR